MWYRLHNSNFKGAEFDTFKNRADTFTMSPTKWVENTGVIGMVSKPPDFKKLAAYFSP